MEVSLKKRGKIMEVSAETREYLEQGRTLLWQGQASEAAAAFARALQLAPDLAEGHLGMAEANLALGSYGLVHMACRRALELEAAGPIGALANALLFILDRRFDRALEATDQAIAANPNQPYAHALRGYCLRRLGRDYEAALAEAKAARMSSNTDFRLLFPPVNPTPQAPESQAILPEPQQHQPAPTQPAWRPHSKLRMWRIRFHFATRTYSLATLTIIMLNVVIFLAGYLFPEIFLQGLGLGLFILQGDYWRLVTGIFINLGWLDLLINMLFLYIIGRWVEQLYGSGRFLLLYLGTGIIGGLLTLLVARDAGFLSVSTAILGIFGVLGAFLWQKGYGAGITLGNWLFWLILNLALTFGFASIWLPTDLGGLAAGLFLGLVLLPDFWKPIRFRFKRGQKARAIREALRPILLTLAVDTGLMLLAALIIHGPIG
jgi:membrane associated rhomboid family serine protease